MRQIANVVKLTQGKEYKKLVSAGGAAVNHIGEGETRTETATPKMNEVTIAVHNIYAYRLIAKCGLSTAINYLMCKHIKQKQTYLAND